MTIRGIGVDLVDVDRMRRSLARTPSLASRLFTDDERAYAERAPDPTERLAARFAAKEAVMKALGVGLGAFDWHDVEVVRTATGAPELRLAGRAAELAARAGISRWLVTLSHTDRTAEAVVVAEGDPGC
jgi:holo-[acyl-carrier protein] synthase